MPSVALSAYLTVEKWTEDRTVQTTPRVTPAHVTYKISEPDGSITSEYLMTYTEGGNASFVFTDVVQADNFAGKKGSFIAQGQGTFDASSYTVKGSFSIVAGSGTAELDGVKGRGDFESKPTKENPGRVQWSCVIEES